MKIKTKLTKLGRNPKKNKGFINPPIFKGSTIIFDDFKSYIKDRDKTNDNEKSKYGIQFNPTRDFLENAITSLFVAKQGKIRGIIHVHDCLRAEVA